MAIIHCDCGGSSKGLSESEIACTHCRMRFYPPPPEPPPIEVTYPIPTFEPHEHDPAVGVVIGAFKWPALVDLQIRCIRHTCGPVPILVSEDPWNPETSSRLREICDSYPDVTLNINPIRLGHVAGDAEAFHKGVIWAERRGLDVVCKVSQRFFGIGPRWLHETARELIDSGLSIASRRCRGGQIFPIRSECCWLRVGHWNRANLLADLSARRWGIPGEAIIWKVVEKHLGGLFWPTSLFAEDRFSRVAGAVWHCSHTAQQYYRLATEFGVCLDPDFHIEGWQHEHSQGEYLHG